MESDELNNCTMDVKEKGQFDIIAILRLITASFSILGTFSIIGSALCGKTVCNPKVQPIFILSVADALLSVLWISGSLVWLKGGVHHHPRLRVNCFSINLLTVILQCVSMNLTLVYALLAYFSIRKRDVYLREQRAQIWPHLFSVSVYLVAWTLPMLLILPVFGWFSRRYQLIEEAERFSCWCLPFYGNMLPRPQIGRNNHGRQSYLVHLHYFITSYAAVLVTNFIIVLLSMVVIYIKIIIRIRQMRQDPTIDPSDKLMVTRNKNLVFILCLLFFVIVVQFRQAYFKNLENENMPLNGATRAMVVEGQREAKKRVLLFIFIYLLTGVMTLVYGIESIYVQVHFIDKHRDFDIVRKAMKTLYNIMILEALFVPVQGFLNAIAYGWTRSGFLSAISARRRRRLRSYSETEVLATSLGTVDENEEEETDEEDNGAEPPTSSVVRQKEVEAMAADAK